MNVMLLGIPCIIFEKLFAAGYKTDFTFALMCVCLLPSLVFTITIEKKYGAKMKDKQDTQR